MTDKAKLEKIKKLADAMYYAAFNLTTDASLLRKAMDEYHQFIIHEYHKEEPVNKDFEMALAEMIDNAQKCVVEPLVVAEQWKDELIKLAKSEEPVSESIDFEQELYKAFGQIKDFTLGVAIAKRFYDMGRKYNEPVSEELEKEIENFLDYSNLLAPIKEVEFIACYFTNWQKEQMMANATKVTVHIDAGGYPYIPQMELYDYDKDIPLAKEGDKYKVILIKEE